MSIIPITYSILPVENRKGLVEVVALLMCSNLNLISNRKRNEFSNI